MPTQPARIEIIVTFIRICVNCGKKNTIPNQKERALI